MDFNHNLASGSKTHADVGSTIPQLETSRDVQQLTYTYYSDDSLSTTHGPYCLVCMNKLFQEGKLDTVSMVYAFTTSGFIPFHIRTLVFLYGVDTPFSVKDVTEDFLVMKCSNCAADPPKLDTVPETDTDEMRIIRCISGRKRKIISQPSKEMSLSVSVKEEIDTLPLKKKTQDIPGNFGMVPAITEPNNIIVTTTLPTSSVSSTPVGITAGDEVSSKRYQAAPIENSAVEKNSPSTVLQNKVAVNETPKVIGIQSTPTAAQPVDGVCGELFSQCDELPVVIVDNDNHVVRDINKESTKTRATNTNVNDDSAYFEMTEFSPMRSAVAKTVKPMLPEGTHQHTATEPTAIADKEKRITPEDCHQGDTELGFNNSGLSTNTYQCSLLSGLSIPPPPVPPSLRGSVHNLPGSSFGPFANIAGGGNARSPSICAHLQADWHFREERALELGDIRQIARKSQEDDSRPSWRFKKRANPSTNDRRESDSVAEMLKSSHGTNKLLSENLLDSRMVEEARDVVKSTGYYNTFLMIPFFTGRTPENPGISFEKLYDGIRFLEECGMIRHRDRFGRFMCELFPEITNIHRCDFCEMGLPSDETGVVYISHFLSFDHIVQAMNKGSEFSRDFISLKKCLLGFLLKNGYHGATRLSGPKLAEYIDQRQFSSTAKDFPALMDRLKHSTSGRKRKIISQPSEEMSLSAIVNVDFDTSPLKKKTEDAPGNMGMVPAITEPNNNIIVRTDLPKSSVPSTAVAITAGDEVSSKIENSAVETNSPSAVSQNKVAVNETPNVIGTDLNTISEKSTTSTAQLIDGVCSELFNQNEELPVMIVDNDNHAALDVNKESTKTRATNTNVNDDSAYFEMTEFSPTRSAVAKIVEPMLPEGTHQHTATEFTAVADKENRITTEDCHQGDIEIGFNKIGLLTNVYQCSLLSQLTILPPPVPPSLRGSLLNLPGSSVGPFAQIADGGNARSLSICAHLQADWGFRDEHALELGDIRQVARKSQEDDSRPNGRFKQRTNPSAVDRRESYSVAEMLKSSHGTNKLLSENLLDSKMVEEARDVVKSKGYYNTFLMIPFFTGRTPENPGISFEKLYDGIRFLEECGMIRHRDRFGRFMCELFPEITNIHRCDFCEMGLPSDGTGVVYISHFLSFDHIVQAMNKGCEFSRDFISLKKCLLGFLLKNGYHDASRLSGPKLAEYIDQRQFSSTAKDFPALMDRLKLEKQIYS